MKKGFLFFLLIIVVFLVTRRQPIAPYAQSRGFTLDTYWEIKIPGGDKKDLARKAGKVLETSIKPFEMIRQDSELSKLNQDSMLTSPSERFKNSLELAIKVKDLTRGYFDPTVFSLLDAHGFYSGNYRIPENTEIKDIVEHKIGLSVEVSSTLIQIKPGQQIDMGALIKGAAVDNAASFLEKQGISDFLINFGGEIRAQGTRSGKHWRVGIKNPFSQDLLGVISLSGSCATSGDYEQFFEIKGKRITHIFSPIDGSNGSDLCSVTVLDPSCALADALSTSILIMGSKRGTEFAQEKGITALLVTKEGHKIATGTFPKFSDQ